MLKLTRVTSLIVTVIVALSAANAAHAQKLAKVSVDVPLVAVDLAETAQDTKQQPSDYLTLVGYRLDIGYGVNSTVFTQNYEDTVWETYAYYSLDESQEAFMQYDLFRFWLFELGVMPSLVHPVDGTYAVAVRLVPLYDIRGKQGADHWADTPQLNKPSL